MATPDPYETRTLPNRARVWAVDDSRTEREFARHSLAETYDVDLFDDGSTVLELIAGGALPDVLILDWHMPNISGLELCRFLRCNHDAASLPILILTASSDGQDVLEGLGAGANDFVSKGSSGAELRARVGALIQVRMLHDSLKKTEQLARQARAEADEANRAKDVFLGVVSHELRTPLNSILGWSRLLVDEQLDEETHRHGLVAIQRNATLQIRLIEDILDTTRIISGKLRVDPRSIDFAFVVRAALETVKMSADVKHHQIELIVEHGACQVLGDAERLQQAVGNLLTNAIKFTPPEGHVRVELRRAESDWELEITDTGKGIAAHLLARLFEPFRQRDGSSSRRFSGLGLGLSLVRHIVEAHGGSVRASSAGEGRGSTFILSLPQQTESSSHHDSIMPSSAPSTLETTSRMLAGLDLLLVEDDEDARELLVTVLNRRGARIRAAATAQTALALIDDSTPDVVLSDIGLPDHDGYEFLALIRGRGYAAQRLPAIALTAYARAEDRKLAFDSGFQGYVAKPVDVDELTATIARVAHPRCAL